MAADIAPKVLAIIPVRGRDAEVDGTPIQLGGKPLIAYTIDAALQSTAVTRTVVTTDSPSTRELAVSLGAEAPFLRPAELAAPNVSLDDVYQHCLEWLERHDGYLATTVLCMEIPHPFRPPELLKQVVTVLEEQQLDTVFTVCEERQPMWRIDEYGELSSIGGEETTPSAVRRPLYRQLAGLALACRGDLLLREGRRFGDRVGIAPLQDPSAALVTQEPLGLVLAEYILSASQDL